MNTVQRVPTIIGIWYIDNMPYNENGILVIHRDGCVVQFPTSVTKPKMNQTMRLWFSEFTGDSVIFSGSPDAPGWLRRLEAVGDDWDMVAESEDDTHRFRCTVADAATLPWWYSEMLEKNLATLGAPQLNQKEAEQDATSNR